MKSAEFSFICRKMGVYNLLPGCYTFLCRNEWERFGSFISESRAVGASTEEEAEPLARERTD
ncbi:MAG: hypothetical protein Q4B32_00280 [Clostridia bacterium]|nr:hypothetical protein [Clostridia bacterium]